MWAVTVTTDGCLPAALDRLYAAVAALCDPVKELHDGQLLVGPSLYEQLVDGITKTGGHGEGRRMTGSRAPTWFPALNLRIDIDNTVKAWCPQERSTVSRLRAVAAGRYRPQDAGDLEDRAALLESWAVEVKGLLEPQRVKHFSVPCPACGASTVYRTDGAGERVRVPALQIVAEQGCTCQACRHTWLPEHYLLLSRVLGFDAPEGVIDD